MRLSFHRKVAVFTDLGRPRLGDESRARSRLYPSTRRLVSVLAHGGVAHVNDGRDEGKSSGRLTRKGDS
jgi:hypothetical protein